jgi:hypothetical protein
MPKMPSRTLLSIAVVFAYFFLSSASSSDARYTGTGSACVSGVNELAIHESKSQRSRIVGYLDGGQCGMNIEAVEGGWTYIRGSDGGRNVQGWVRNRFLRARNRRSSPDPGNEENNVASARSCRFYGRVRTRDSNFPIRVRFINRTRSIRVVAWLDQRGRPREYQRLAPGASYVQQTFAGHPWMLMDGPGNCKEIFIPKRNSTRYVISFDR